MMRFFRYYLSPRKTVFIFGEGLLIYGSVALAAFILLWREAFPEEILQTNWWRILIVTLVTQLSLYFHDLYEFKKNVTLLELATLLIQAIGITSIGLALVYFLWPDAMVGRWVFFVSVVFLLLFVVSWRLLYAYVIQKRLFSEKAIMVGNGALAGDILKGMKDRKDIAYDIKFIIAPGGAENQANRYEDIPIHHGFDGMCDIADAEAISSIIVALDQKRGVMPYQELLNCKVRGISIIDGESFYERITGRLLVEKINPSWLIFSDGFVKSRTSRLLKRIVGLVLSTVMLILLSPLMVLVAIAIKLESPGPVLFTQERVGEYEKLFTVYKFRSMRADAEKETGPVWATEDDARITRVGRIIRKLRIDELPQLWNVFKGDMSFVGPRPERPYFVKQLKEKIPYYRERFAVKPGVTGWAQVKYPYGASEKDALEKLKYDLYYIKNMSLLMDFIVIFHTVKIVLLGRGSR